MSGLLRLASQPLLSSVIDRGSTLPLSRRAEAMLWPSSCCIPDPS
jgi:hypothetical protein